MTGSQQENSGTFPVIGGLIRSICRPIRWLWRKTWRFSLALLILLIIAHIIINFTAGRKLEAELARIRSAGDPLTFTQVAPPPLPEAENAAVLYQKVFNGLPDEEESEIITHFNVIYPSADEPRPTLAQMEEIFTKHETELQLLKEASLMEKARFPLDWEAGPALLFTHLAKMRAATRLLLAKARAEALQGNSGEALATLSVIVRMANHVGTEPSMISQLVHNAMMGMMFSALPEILTAAPPTAAEARAFYDLLEKVDAINLYVTAMKAERVCGLSVFEIVRREAPIWHAVEMQGLLTETIPEQTSSRIWPVIRPIWEPFLKLDQLFYLEWMGKIIRLSEKSYAESKQEYENISLLNEESVPPYALVSKMMTPVFFRAQEKRDQMIAVYHITQAALALRAYQIKHGEYPDSLEQIDPSWEIKSDPFTGKPLVYHRESDGYLIYSLGADGSDNDGIDFRTARQQQAGVHFAELTYDVPLRMPHKAKALDDTSDSLHTTPGVRSGRAGRAGGSSAK